MTDQLKKFFDLPLEEEPQNDSEIIEDVIEEEITTQAMTNLEKIDDALPAIRGLESSDKEMDDIAKMAADSYQQLMTLGMNVEARHASEIFSSASNFLGHAITAKQAKINKKLKMIDMQLKKAKLDFDKDKVTGDIEPEDTGTAHIMDRNELLAEVLKQVNNKPDDK